MLDILFPPLPWHGAERCDSGLERVLLAAMRRVVPSCYRIEQQVPIGRYRVDFLVADVLVVEADGAHWHAGLRRRLHDWKRDRFLRRRGFRVLRLSEAEIRRDPEAAAGRVVGAI